MENDDYYILYDKMKEMLKINNQKIDNYKSPTVTSTSASDYWNRNHMSTDWSDYRYWSDISTSSTTSVDKETVRHMELVARMERLEKLVETRLLVLRPDPEMLEKWELLQDIYDQYKSAEALLFGNDDD